MAKKAPNGRRLLRDCLKKSSAALDKALKYYQVMDVTQGGRVELIEKALPTLVMVTVSAKELADQLYKAI